MHDQMTHKNHYLRLLAMAVLSFISMYILMYAMVNTFADVYPNLNQFYMAALMTAPMMVIELTLMGMMYQNKRLNALLIVGSILVGIASFVLIRQQTAISDRQFLRSMIPHHSGAILMCEQADLRNTEIRELCEGIVIGQQQEIDQMNRLLDELND